MTTETINALYEPPRGWSYNRKKWQQQVDTIRAVERDRIINIVLKTVNQDQTEETLQRQTEETREYNVQNI